MHFFSSIFHKIYIFTIEKKEQLPFVFKKTIGSIFYSFARKKRKKTSIILIKDGGARNIVTFATSTQNEWEKNATTVKIESCLD